MAISSREFLHVSICNNSNFKCSCDVNNFTAILMQINFIHNVNGKLASSSLSHLRSGDEIRWVFEKSTCQYSVIVSVTEGGNILKFNCCSGKCSVITVVRFTTGTLLNFLGFIKKYPGCRPAACKKFQQSQLEFLPFWENSVQYLNDSVVKSSSNSQLKLWWFNATKRSRNGKNVAMCDLRWRCELHLWVF